MCFDTMDKNTKHMKTDCLRKNMKPGSKMRWRQLHVSTEEALKPCRPGAMKGNFPKCLRREQKQTQFAKLSKILGVMGKKQKMEAVYEERHAAAFVEWPQAGAMAPSNTTQYLMSNVYEDMKTNSHTVPVQQETSAHLYAECLSPSSVYSALDSGYESCLAFQQRNFEEMFDLCCGALDGARPPVRQGAPLSPAQRNESNAPQAPARPRIVKSRSPLPTYLPAYRLDCEEQGTEEVT